MKNFRSTFKHIRKVQKQNYAVALKLDEEIAQALKPEISKRIYDKGDEDLIKKMNLCGNFVSARLNIAPEEMLNTLSGDNVFSILADELPDVWEYYWADILECGQDVDKWTEALKEVQDYPLLVDKGFRFMGQMGLVPHPDHYEVYAQSLAPSGDNNLIHGIWMDMFTQNLLHQNADQGIFVVPAFRAWLKSCPIKDWVQLAYGQVEKYNRTGELTSEDMEAYKQLCDLDQTEYHHWVLKNSVGKPPETYWEHFIERRFRFYLNELDEDKKVAYVQPSVEKLYNVSDAKKDQSRKVKKNIPQVY